MHMLTLYMATHHDERTFEHVGDSTHRHSSPMAEATLGMNVEWIVSRVVRPCALYHMFT
jgi:hypothetical protein